MDKSESDIWKLVVCVNPFVWENDSYWRTEIASFEGDMTFLDSILWIYYNKIQTILVPKNKNFIGFERVEPAVLCGLIAHNK